MFILQVSHFWTGSNNMQRSYITKHIIFTRNTYIGKFVEVEFAR